MRRLTSMAESFLARKTTVFKTAVIAPEDLNYEMARLYQTVSQESPENVQVFREIYDGLAWIGLDESLAEELFMRPPECGS